jgi:hypothetical protein
VTLTKYKLTNKDMQTHDGFQWELGKENFIRQEGNTLCTDQVFHYYDSPELASLFNIIHANISEPRLFMVECDSVAHDGLKGGSKCMKFVKELTVVEFSTKQRVIFSILVALENYPKWEKYDAKKEWKQWTDNYLSNKDISESAANAAWSAANAAWSAARSAESAARSAANAARSAESAANAARSVANAEEQSRLFQSIALKVLSMNL